MSTWDWANRAACRGMDTGLFFPPGTQPPSARALAACQSCPVTRECYDTAMEWRMDGVWGGTTGEERDAERRRAARRALAAARRRENAA